MWINFEKKRKWVISTWKEEKVILQGIKGKKKRKKKTEGERSEEEKIKSFKMRVWKNKSINSA